MTAALCWKDRQKDNDLKEIENSENEEKVFYENVVQIGKKTDWNKIENVFRKAVQQNHLGKKYEKKITRLKKRIADLNGKLGKLKRFVESRELGGTHAEYLQSLAPKTMRQKVKETKAEAAVSERAPLRGLFGTVSDRETERTSADGAGSGGTEV